MPIPTTAEQFRDTFQKACVIADDLTVRFEHQGSEYHLKSPCFEGLKGKTVLINSAMEVQRSEKLIGKAVPA